VRTVDPKRNPTARGRPEETNVTFRLPVSLYRQLKEWGEKGVSEEIRRRLDFTFKIPDQPTEELISAIAYVANSLEIEGAWHKDPFVFEVLKATIDRLLDHWKPEGEPKTPRSGAMFDKDTKPQAAARMLAAFALNPTLTPREPGR
jgi:hypothetical protein